MDKVSKPNPLSDPEMRAWHRGLHMRDTEVAELREENGRLAREAIGMKVAWEEVRAENELARTTIDAQSKAVLQLSAENERLRAALRACLYVSQASEAHFIAERALEQQS